MELDDETRAELGELQSAWEAMMEEDYVTQALCRHTTQEAQVGRARTSSQVAWAIAPTVRRSPENQRKLDADYQRNYAATEAGREQRRAASRAYRQRRKAAQSPPRP